MRTMLVIFTLAHLSLVAQPKIKKTIVEGDGIPFVMLAGATADMSVFAIPSKELSLAYKVIRMENFNVQYATEEKILPKNYSVAIESEAIRYTLDSLHVTEPIVLLGHSYGGLIALDFALRHPDRVRALILLEPPVFSIADANHESPTGMKEMRELTRELTTEAEITEQLVERFRCELLNCDSSPVREHPQWRTWVKQKNRLRGLVVVGVYELDLKKLRQFQKPVLIITGSNTVVFHKRIDELLGREFAMVKTFTIQSGHAIPSTAPQELVRSVKEFLK